MMRIGIDLRPMESYSKNRGIGYFTSNLFSNILKLRKIPHQFIFYTTLTSSLPNTLKVSSKDSFFRVFTVFRPLRLIRKFDPLVWFFWNISLKITKPDLLHITSLFEVYYLCIPKNIKYVVTIYDLIPILYARKYFKDQNARIWYNERLEQVKLASKIITISQSAKLDLQRILKIPKEKITVVYSGINERFRPLDKNKTKGFLLKKYGIKNKYILSVGSATLNKNVNMIFRAFTKYLAKFKDKDTNLVVICQLIKKEEKLWRQKLQNLGIKKRVIITNFIPDDDMPYFYAGAQYLLFPSLYEGFGLPIVEAMSCGTPVITSRVASMPEAGGDAAYYINPTRVQDIVDGMYKVLNDKKLRDSMIKKGFVQAKKFSWDKAAQQTLKVYQEILEDG